MRNCPPALHPPYPMRSPTGAQPVDHAERQAQPASCGARRKAESAALLVDEVFPEQSVRQWGEGRPFVRWTYAASRTTGQDIRAGTPRHGWLWPHTG